MIDSVLLKVASRCNIDCSYCYVYQMGDLGWLRQPKLMARQTCVAVGDALNELAFGYGCQFAVVLHGANPYFLEGKTWGSFSALYAGLFQTHARLVSKVMGL